MRKLITLLLTISTIVIFGQSSISFTHPESTWNIAKTFPNGNLQNPFFIETSTKVYGYQGDTIINNEPWLKMYVTADSTFTSDLIFCGLVHEKNGLILFRDTANIVDTIYNFNIQVGDSVLYNFYGAGGQEYLEILSIDSIEINNSFQKRFFIEESSYEPFYLNEYWIEGIGSIHGPLFSKHPVLFSQELPADSLFTICYKTENDIIWNNPSYEICYVNIVLFNNEILDNSINIFPNPVKNKLRIELQLNEEIEYKVSIIDLSGKLQIHNINKKDYMAEINVSTLKSGFYILLIETNNNLYRQKFIKE